jgi:hypothetical protein
MKNQRNERWDVDIKYERLKTFYDCSTVLYLAKKKTKKTGA